MYKRTLALVAMLAALACSSNGPVSSPTSVVPDVPATSAPVAAPQAVTPDTGAGFTGSIGSGGSWTITNLTASGQSYTAYWTDFDNQRLARGSQDSGLVKPNGSFSGSFNLSCAQIDVSQFGAGGQPLIAGFIGKDGNLFNPSNHPEKVAECRKGPDPKPTPTIEPPPTDPTCKAGEKLVEHKCVPKTCKDDQYQCPIDCKVSDWSCKVFGTATACLQGHYTKPWTQTRTIIVQPAYGGAVCPALSKDGFDTFDCQSYCYYNVSKKSNNWPFTKEKNCTNHGGAWGSWLNDPKLNDHCRFAFSGISDDDFQLTPGQSDPLCLDKHN